MKALLLTLALATGAGLPETAVDPAPVAEAKSCVLAPPGSPVVGGLWVSNFRMAHIVDRYGACEADRDRALLEKTKLAEALATSRFPSALSLSKRAPFRWA